MKSFIQAAIICVALVVAGASLGAQAVRPVKAAEVKSLMAQESSAERPVLLDVRTAEEFATGCIPGAILLPYDRISKETAAARIDRLDRTVIVYCRSGRRSALAAASLARLGYTKILDLGGIGNWPYGVVKP